LKLKHKKSKKVPKDLNILTYTPHNADKMTKAIELEQKILVQRTVESYNKAAEHYASIAYDEGYLVVAHQIDKLLAKLGPNPKIVDLCCGPGHYSLYMAKRGAIVMGIDLSDEMLRIARMKAEEEGVNASFIKMNLLELDLLQEEYNGAISTASFFHVPKKEALRVLRDVYNSLKPRAWMFMSTQTGNGHEIRQEEKYGVQKMKRYFNYYESRQLVSLFEQTGFIVEESYTAGCNIRTKTVHHKHNWIHVYAKKPLKLLNETLN